MLRGIEDLKVKGLRFDQMEDKIRELAETHLKAASREETARKDAASHFVVRLGFCLTEDKRRWLLAQVSGQPAGVVPPTTPAFLPRVWQQHAGCCCACLLSYPRGIAVQSLPPLGL